MSWNVLCAHMFPYEDSKSVSVWLSAPREKKSPWPRQYQFYISNWCINRKVFTSSYSMETQKFDFFFFKKVLTCAKSQNHLSFINILSTLVIYASMERSSRVLQHGNLKIWIFFKFWWPATDRMSPKLIAALIFLDRNMLTCFRCHILLAIFSFYNVSLISILPHAIHIHSCMFRHISVLTSCSYAHLFFDKFAPLNLHS